jgi:hypothetical protein
MSVSSITTFGSAAIVSPPANDGSNAKSDNQPAEIAAAPQVEAAKPPGTGQFVDKTV